MSHYCICPKCQTKFDRDKIQAVKISARRYGHASCYPENTDLIPMEEKIENSEDYKKLMEYIKKLYGNKANYPLINKQIKKFTEENKYSLSGILKSLVYFHEVKGNPVTESSHYALGIVPFTYQDAYNYYFSIFMAQQANENKIADNKVIEIIIKPPKGRNYLKREFFNLEEWENNEE